MKYNDNAQYPIIAMDFDGTMDCDSTNFPIPGEPRLYARRVVNFLHDIGVKVVFWTSRDMGLNDDGTTVHNDLQPMIDWLSAHDVRYDAINSSIKFAPFAYESRKVYAHMYIDDRAFGFNRYDENIMVTILRRFLYEVVGVPAKTCWDVFNIFTNPFVQHDIGGDMDFDNLEKECKKYVDSWHARTH